MNDQGKPTIIVKRITKGGGGHHGGAWKIAYADFVTAMMAFFLLMWLLGSTSRGDQTGMTMDVHSPLKITMPGGSGSGDSSNVLKGAGTDPTKKTGQVKRGDVEAKKATVSLNAGQRYKESSEDTQFKSLRRRIDEALETRQALRQLKHQVLVDVTTKGLRIQLVDAENRPMFSLAQAELKLYTRELLQEIGGILHGVPNRVALAGHTDARPYSSGERGYSNWELSIDRANAARRELIAGGMDEAKVLRVVGLSSTVSLNANDPNDPVNRRISIIVLNKRAEDEFAQSHQAADPDAAASATPEKVSADQPAHGVVLAKESGDGSR